MSGLISIVRITANPCGSGLARESAVSVAGDFACADVFASKLAPTGGGLLRGGGWFRQRNPRIPQPLEYLEQQITLGPADDPRAADVARHCQGDAIG